jgi:hypothetical protein
MVPQNMKIYNYDRRVIRSKIKWLIIAMLPSLMLAIFLAIKIYLVHQNTPSILLKYYATIAIVSLIPIAMVFLIFKFVIKRLMSTSYTLSQDTLERNILQHSECVKLSSLTQLTPKYTLFSKKLYMIKIKAGSLEMDIVNIENIDELFETLSSLPLNKTETGRINHDFGDYISYSYFIILGAYFAHKADFRILTNSIIPIIISIIALSKRSLSSQGLLSRKTEIIISSLVIFFNFAEMLFR